MNIRRSFHLVIAVLFLLVLSIEMRWSHEEMGGLLLAALWALGAAGLFCGKTWGWWLSVLILGIFLVHTVSWACFGAWSGLGVVFVAGAILTVIAILVLVCVVTSRPQQLAPKNGVGKFADDGSGTVGVERSEV